jgi:putative endonuclease
MYNVYVLLSKSTNKLYIGQTNDLPRRLQEHETGLARYTSGRGPWKLILSEQFSTRAEAMQREKSLKSSNGREWLKTMLNGRACPPKAD